MNTKILQLAIQEAQKSEHQHRLGCVIFKKKSIISKAYNKPFAFHSCLHPKYQNYFGSVHAEVAAIISAKKDLRNCELCVVRLGSKGDLRLSLPCEYCMTYIVDVGVKKVYYTDNNEKLNFVRVRKHERI